MIEVIFWLVFALTTYVYLGYPLVLIIVSWIKPAPLVTKDEVTPSVSLIIPAHNEEKFIAEKLENSLAVDYPPHKLEIVVASDGSTDGTTAIVKRYAARGVRLVTLDSNDGKSAAQNVAVSYATGDILIFSDANVAFGPDTVQKLVGNFADERVGCAVGKVTYVNERVSTVAEGEGFYWRYELFVRRKESQLGNLAMGSGPIMAVRRTLFQPLNPDVGEDFVLPITAALRGYRVVYEPDAISEEILFQIDPRSMFRSKVRIICKDLRGLLSCRAILNPVRYPLYAWGLVSHKLLRWLVPYFLIVLLIFNLLLLGQPLYDLLFVMQTGFYGLALAGYVWQRTAKVPRAFGAPFSFCLVNVAALVGVARFATGKTSGRWTPVR